MIFKFKEGQTPIDAAEAEALIPALSTQEELDLWEEKNVLLGRKWVLSKRVLNRFDPLSEKDILVLHKRMFGDTWKWAGTIRMRDKSIGVPFYNVRPELRHLLDDARYWQQEKTYDVTEIAVRVHHRLVKIHLFPNGNGRHARLIADIIAKQGSVSEFTWGGGNLIEGNQLRAAYIAALKRADEGDYADLICFSSA